MANLNGEHCWAFACSHVFELGPLRGTNIKALKTRLADEKAE